MENQKDINRILVFLRERFSERYITPMRVDRKKKNGFTIMAVSCLMIETLESFYRGWNDTKNKSELAFCNFFDRNKNFAFINNHAREFYIHVRCGILHQAETTGGWHIRREGIIFDPVTKTLNATKFLSEVENSLIAYCAALSQANWEDEIWQNLRNKMNSICRNSK